MTPSPPTRSPLPLYDQLLERARAAGQGGAPARPSAAVVPWRRTPDGLEVFWVHRSPAVPFMGGWHAFPGGGVARQDAALAVLGLPAGTALAGYSDPEPEVDAKRRSELGPDLVPGLLSAAIRELFEETGLLLTAGYQDQQPADRPRLAELRQHLLDKKVDFPQLVAAEGWQLAATPLVFAGRWLTPPFAPLRFDNRFFLLEWPPTLAIQPQVVPGELMAGEWIRPELALRRWRQGEIIAAPPILHLLTVLAEEGPERGLGRLRQPDEVNFGPFRRIEFRPGVILLPLLTPTLPPATHTNAFLLGHRKVVLIDPATPIAEETARLERALHAARARGLELQAIWLTHHHRDHVGAVTALRQTFSLPVLAHEASIPHLVRQGITVDGELHDGDRIVLAGDPPFPVRVIHTPGHTRGHLCFFDETYGSLIAGDLVSSLSTIVIDPPEGDMDAYLASLDKVLALAPRTLFPGHGAPILAAEAKLTEYRNHRFEREAMIRRAFEAGAREAAAIVAQVYTDVPAEIHPVAERQVLAHLERLERHGLIVRS